MNVSMNRILQIVKEEVNIFEAEVTSHAKERIDTRLKRMTANHDITMQEAGTIDSNLNNILRFDFNPNRSYGIMLGRFNINPNSRLVTKKHKSGTYYEINSMDEYDIVKDSTGNEFWGIVRNNRLITAFLRKTIQRKTAENPRDSGGLGVDEVIDNFDDYIKEIEQKKEFQQQREFSKQKELEKRIRINGVWWEIDDTRQIVYKKNNPQISIGFNDVLENPEWDEQTKEEILNKIG